MYRHHWHLFHQNFSIKNRGVHHCVWVWVLLCGCRKTSRLFSALKLGCVICERVFSMGEYGTPSRKQCRAVLQAVLLNSFSFILSSWDWNEILCCLGHNILATSKLSTPLGILRKSVKHGEFSYGNADLIKLSFELQKREEHWVIDLLSSERGIHLFWVWASKIGMLSCCDACLLCLCRKRGKSEGEIKFVEQLDRRAFCDVKLEIKYVFVRRFCLHLCEV